MLAQRLAVAARPLALRRALPVASTTALRSFKVSFPRDPILAPLDPKYYPPNDPALDPGMVGAPPVLPTRQWQS